MRAADLLGPDELECTDRSFAVGDRVIATRNDRRLEIHNGQAGVLTAIGEGRMSVQLPDGRELELPRSYAQEGHLDYGYALTAHRAQGATVDVTFVLGSDELTREWGYTALTRHREEAHFYVSARPAFVNEPARAIATTEDVELEVLRALATSHVNELAAPHTIERHHADVERAERNLREAEERLADIDARRAATSRVRRRARAALDERASGLERQLEAAAEELAERRHVASLLPCLRIGRHVRFCPAELERHLSRRRL